jgi:hypothetical protein
MAFNCKVREISIGEGGREGGRQAGIQKYSKKDEG